MWNEAKIRVSFGSKQNEEGWRHDAGDSRKSHLESPEVKSYLRQARDGKWYTWDSFLAYYRPNKARTMWNEAKIHASFGSKQNEEGWRHDVGDSRKSHLESPEVKSYLRQARDGKWYTWGSFLAYY